MFDHVHSKNKKLGFSPSCLKRITCISLSSFVLFLSLGTTEKGLTLLFFFPLITHFYRLIWFLWSCSFQGWAIQAFVAFPHLTNAPVTSSSLYKVQKFKVQKVEICTWTFKIQDLYGKLSQIVLNPPGSTWLFGHYGK